MDGNGLTPSGSGQGQMTGFFECSDEPSGSTKFEEILTPAEASQEGLCSMELVS